MSVEVIKYGDPVKGSNAGLVKNITETCIQVTAQAKLLAPVNKEVGVGGQLRNSIMWKLANGKNGGLDDSGGDKSENKLSVTPPKGSGYVGANTDYATFVEYGTRNMDAQPYLRPAAEIVTKGAGAAESVKKIMNDEMTKAIRAGKKVKTYT